MGFGSFLKKLTKSPLKATGALLHGKPGQAFKIGVTGGGTAPFSRYAPLLGGGQQGQGPLTQGLAGMMQGAPPPPPMGGMVAAPVQQGGQMQQPDMEEIRRKFMGSMQ